MQRIRDFIQEHVLASNGNVKAPASTDRWWKKRDALHIRDEIFRLGGLTTLRDNVFFIMRGPCICARCGVNTTKVWPAHVAAPWYCSDECRWDRPTQRWTEDRKERFKKTCLEKYGSGCPANFNLEEVLLEKYGVRSVSQIPGAKEKAQASRSETVNHPDYRYNRIVSMLDDMGIDHSRYSRERIESLPMNPRNDREFIVAMLNGFPGVDSVGHEIFSDRSLSQKYIDMHRAGRSSDIKSMFSQRHAEVVSWFGEDVVINDRKIIAPRELDVVIHRHNLAVEIHGSYWHSEQNYHSTYHQEKVLACKDAGIRLVSVFEWHDMSMVRSHLESLTGRVTRIGARQCTIDSSREGVHEFIRQNHLSQYSPPFGQCVRLIYQGELVAVMTFGVSRFDRKHDYEILRMCSRQDMQVVGGASRMFREFIRQQDPASIVSYHDLALGPSRVYSAIGMTNAGVTDPSWKWFKGSTHLSRYQCQRSNLPKILGDEFRPELTQDANMRSAGWVKVYDCGNEVWTWTRPDRLTHRKMVDR